MNAVINSVISPQALETARLCAMYADSKSVACNVRHRFNSNDNLTAMIHIAFPKTVYVEPGELGPEEFGMEDVFRALLPIARGTADLQNPRDAATACILLIVDDNKSIERRAEAAKEIVAAHGLALPA